MDERGAGPDPKRRKLRKGTHSCWGCKRRKIRCTFSTVSKNCDDCRRRGDTCVSQEVPETLAQQIHRDQADGRLDGRTDNRLDRIEALVYSLSKKIDGGVPNNRLEDDALDETVNESTCDQETRLANLEDTYELRPIASSEGELNTYTTWLGHQRVIEDEVPQTASLPSTTPISTTASSTACGSGTPVLRGSIPIANKYYLDKYKGLMAAWPLPADLCVLVEVLSAPQYKKGHLAMLVGPTSTVLAASIPQIGMRDIADLQVVPPEGTPLALVALKLLTIALFLQRLDAGQDDTLRLSVSTQKLMKVAVEAASGHVVTQECLIGSLEGVHCLVLMGIFHANQGSLRRAWLAVRKAMIMAQLMGMQRGGEGEGPPVLDPATRHLLPPRCLWFRIVFADRYLSLMLGLPQGAPGDQVVANSSLGRQQRAKMAAALALPVFGSDTEEARQASEHVAKVRRQLWKIEYRHSIIVGRIIERNEAWRGLDGDLDDDSLGMDGFDTDTGRKDREDRLSTEAIDWALQQASQSMPAQWWLTPSADEWDAHDGIFAFLLTQRVVDQLFHYHLLAQLHLPFMFGGDSSSPLGQEGTAYSKITCVSASREVLTRFLSLRQTHCVAISSCRSIDFFTLLASMTLCLAHLDSHQRKRTNSARMGDFLAHQRPSDRGMMDRVFDTMEARVRTHSDDALSRKSVVLLRRILAMEEAAAMPTDALPNDEGLRIWVPHLGTIQLSRDGIVRVGGGEKGDNNDNSRQIPSDAPVPESDHEDPLISGPNAFQYTSSIYSDDTLQGVDLAFFENLFAHSSLEGVGVSGPVSTTSLPALDMRLVG